MRKAPLCDLLGIKYPIIQGSMAHISDGNLAGAVSEAGGLGIISAGFETPEYLKEQIDIARSITRKPFGVNIILENPRAFELAQLVAEEKVPVITTGAGTPEPFMPILIAAGCKVIPVIPHTRAAIKMEKAGAIAVIAEGRESGGHVGQMSTLPLIPQVCDAVKIPVIAAGGIADGRGFMASIMLGAIGVQMGTAFLVAKECSISQLYKDKVIASTDRDSVITGLGTVKEVRNIKNVFTDKYNELIRQLDTEEEVDKLLMGSLQRAINGDEMGSFQAGQTEGLIKKEKTAKQIIEDIMVQAEAIYNKYFNA